MTTVAAGSTLGGPKCVCIIKATGAIEKIYSSDYGKAAIGTLVVHHWVETTGISLTAMPGRFRIHPEHQEHLFALSNGIEVHETIFVLSGEPRGDPGRSAGRRTSRIALTNPTRHPVSHGNVRVRATARRHGPRRRDARSTAAATPSWPGTHRIPSFARVMTCSEPVTSWETTMDHGKAVAHEIARHAFRTSARRPRPIRSASCISATSGAGRAGASSRLR